MQSVLFLLEEADAYRQNGKTNLALKKYMAVKKVFDDYEDDQFDFHGYNLRKFTINIYLKCVFFRARILIMPNFLHLRLLKWENQLRSHPAYIKAVIETSKVGFH